MYSDVLLELHRLDTNKIYYNSNRRLKNRMHTLKIGPLDFLAALGPKIVLGIVVVFAAANLFCGTVRSNSTLHFFSNDF